MMASRLNYILCSFLLAATVLSAPTTAQQEHERRHGGHHEAGKPAHKHGFAVKAHGTLLTLAFSFLYPAGVVLIRGGFKRGFFMHWATQGGATAAALTGMLIMIVKAWTRLLNGKAGLHHYIGSSIFIAVCLQVMLGYYHHVLFVKLRRRTSISYAHIVLGWLVVCGGWVNTFLGFRMGGISTPLVAIWFLWLVVVSVVMIKAPTLARFVKRPQGDAAGKYDAVEQDDIVERKGSRDDDSLRMESFAVGE